MLVFQTNSVGFELFFFYVNAFFCSKRICVYAVQTRFATGWENNRDGDITMPLSLKILGIAG